MSEQILMPRFRAAWTQNLFSQDKNSVYSITMLVDKTPENEEKLKPLVTALKAKCEEVHGPNAWAEKGTKKPIQDGDTMIGKNGEILKEAYPFYEGRYVIRANSKYEVSVVKPGGRKPDGSTSWVEAQAQDIYPGCHCQASVSISAGNYQGKYIKLYLQGVGKVGDDTPFEGGRQPVDSMFASVDTSEFEMQEEASVAEGMGELLG